jgi:hypothetical protein
VRRPVIDRPASPGAGFREDIQDGRRLGVNISVKAPVELAAIIEELAVKERHFAHLLHVSL